MKKKKSILVSAVLGFILILSIALCGCDLFDSSDSGGDEGSGTSGKLAVAGTPKMEVEYSEMFGYSVTITGTLKNGTKKKYDYVSITYTLYDAEGNNLGTALDNMNYLDAGETWKFTAKTIGWVDSEPVSCKCSNITAF